MSRNVVCTSLNGSMRWHILLLSILITLNAFVLNEKKSVYALVLDQQEEKNQN